MFNFMEIVELFSKVTAPMLHSYSDRWEFQLLPNLVCLSLLFALLTGMWNCLLMVFICISLMTKDVAFV